MKEYIITIVKNKPDYVGRCFLLSNKDKTGLFKTKDDELVQLKINSSGLLQCTFIKNGNKNKKDYTLRKIGIDFLEKKDPSVNSVLKYLITPEIEIERIFNCIRYKYLNSILLSDIENPSEKISAKFNNAFQSFAGIKIYQGNTKNRVDNNVFWTNAGFSKTAKNKISFKQCIKDLDFIIRYLRKIETDNYNKIYAELIAIKPGFHEIYIHSNYFDKDENYRSIIKAKDKERDIVFKSLRGFGSIESVSIDSLKPSEINRMKYFSYASCNITEGPFVFRKNIGISYFDEIQKIKNRDDFKKLNDNFQILDYYHNKPTTKKELEKLLEEAEKFKKYLNN